MLVQLPRRKFIWMLFHFFYDFRADHGLPIYGVFDREVVANEKASADKSDLREKIKAYFDPPGERMAMSDNEEQHFAFYLRPDRLRWSTWGLGLLLGLTLLLTSHHWVMAIFSFLWMGIGIQSIVYRLRRIPVLNQIWPSWPSSMNSWMKGIPQSGFDTPTYNEKLLVRLGHSFISFFPKIGEGSDMVTWMPTGSAQESFLRAAVVDHFVGLSESPETSSRRVIFRWIFDWLFPVWGSLPILFSFAAYCAIFKSNSDKMALTCLAVSWFLGTMYILWRESQAISRWCCLSHQDILSLPASVRRLVREQNPFIIHKISSKFILTVQTIAQGTILFMFLTFADNL